MTIEPVIIGLGGNVGSESAIIDRFRCAREAIAALGAVRSAPLYRSTAIGPAQPSFLNTALRLELEHAQPGELIATLLEIERLLGREREREARWGPRPIDLDVLVWGQRELVTPELTVPHPLLAERRFALAPLVDLVDDFAIPGVGSAHAALARVLDQTLEQVAARW